MANAAMSTKIGKETVDRLELLERGTEVVFAVLLCASVQRVGFFGESRATSSASPALPSASTRALACRKRSVALRAGSTSSARSIRNFVLPPSL